MKLCAFLVVTISLCSSRSPVDDKPLLKYLDDKINEQLYDPIEGNGKKLARNLRTYNKRLAEVLDMIQQDVLDAFVKSKSLLKIGGPQFLQAHFDKGLSKYIYNWTEEQVQSLSAGLKETKRLWAEIVSALPEAEKKFDQILTEEKKTQQNVFDREKQRIKDFHGEWDEFQEKRKVEKEREAKEGKAGSKEEEESVDSSEYYDSSKTRSASSILPSEFEAKTKLDK